MTAVEAQCTSASYMQPVKVGSGSLSCRRFRKALPRTYIPGLQRQ